MQPLHLSNVLSFTTCLASLAVLCSLFLAIVVFSIKGPLPHTNTINMFVSNFEVHALMHTLHVDDFEFRYKTGFKQHSSNLRQAYTIFICSTCSQDAHVTKMNCVEKTCGEWWVKGEVVHMLLVWPVGRKPTGSGRSWGGRTAELRVPICERGVSGGASAAMTSAIPSCGANLLGWYQRHRQRLHLWLLVVAQDSSVGALAEQVPTEKRLGRSKARRSWAARGITLGGVASLGELVMCVCCLQIIT